uniref:Uncharacterized protein n=1 Tax=Hyaloperonospora arabidopsidis (strain Emoy2) TaxID=559515 RepID=M4C1Y2_HYAAE
MPTANQMLHHRHSSLLRQTAGDLDVLKERRREGLEQGDVMGAVILEHELLPQHELLLSCRTHGLESEEGREVVVLGVRELVHRVSSRIRTWLHSQLE